MAPTTPTVRPSNGVSPSSHTPDAAAGVNRKKAKRRAKEAAKRAAENGHSVTGAANVNNGHPPYSISNTSNASSVSQNLQTGRDVYGEEAYNDHAVYDEGSPEEAPYSHMQFHPPYANGHGPDHSHTGNSHDPAKQKRKSKVMPQQYDHAAHHHHQYPNHSHVPPPPPTPPVMSQAALRTVQKNSKDRIWNTSTQEERERIKDFWLSLKEEERKSLVKIEKEAVLRKMKEQQKHSCSCTVCGRKRTAIEEELEVLYDAYYEELEQYANEGNLWPPPLVDTFPRPPLSQRDDQRASRLPPDHMSLPPHAHRPPQGHVEELPDDEEEEEEEDEEDPDEEDYSEDDYDEDEEYSDEEPEELPRPSADFFNFGNSLTVKGGILTVADDLLKNDGKKFIEMMEQLAERRMQREEEAQYAAASHPNSHSQQGYPDTYRHNHAPPEEEFDDEEDDDEYDSQEDYEEEDEDMDTMTEEQRMQEGRRMFQIFAARMFEQRVLTAYREKVAAERQQKLLEELEEEKGHDAAREAKKAKDAEKRKQKKQAQKQKQAEEKAKKDAEKAAQEAAVKEAELKRQEELKKKREEQRLKKEEQRKSQEAELARKNAEKLKRQKEEQDRRQEAERKIREQKEAEKKAKEEMKKKEREEREAKERKSKAEKERKEREAREKSEKETQARKETNAVQQAHAVQQAAQAAKRAAAPAIVPLPPGLHKQTSNFGSPHVAVATPAIPKAPTPNVRPRQGSQQTSKGSSPKTPAVAIGQKATSPGGNASHQSGSNPIAPRTILSRPPSQPPGSGPHQAMNHMHPIAPPPGMGMPGIPPFGMPPGMNGFHHQGPMMPGMRTPMQNVSHMFGPQQPPIGGQFRPFIPNGMPGPPPGMGGPGMPSFGQGPPGFPPPMAGPPPGFGGPIRDTMPAHSMPAQHSRNQSGGSSTVEATAGPTSVQTIQRPAPIQRPSSVKPHEQDRSNHADVDELSSHLGSSALLDDDEAPEPLFQDRRPSMAPGIGRAPSNLSSAFGMPGIFTNINNQPRMDAFGAPGSNPSSSWSTPSLPFQQSNLSSANGWGSSPTSGWSSNNGLSFGNNVQQGGRPRLYQIRINMCEACKALTNANKNTTDGFHDARTVFSQARERVQPPAMDEDMLMLLETEGTTQNGGGSFQLKKLGAGPMDMLVKWTPDGGDGPSQTRIGSIGVGEIGSQIGSPLLGATNPGSANATPFGSLRGFSSLGGLGTGL